MIDPVELKRALGSSPEGLVPSYFYPKSPMFAVLVEATLDAPEPERTAAIAALRKALVTEKYQDLLQHNGYPPKIQPLPGRLAEFLDSANPEVRFLGAAFIRAVWMPAAIPGLMRGLRDEDAQVRDACLSALRGKTRHKPDPTSLRELLSSERVEVRYVTLRLLASTQEPPLYSRQPCPLQEELQQVFEAPDATAPVRACAAALLDGALNLPGLWEATLDAIRTESDSDIRHHALGRLGRLHEQPPERISASILVISEALKKNPESDWRFAIGALRSLGPTHDMAIEVLIDAFRFIPGQKGTNFPEQEVISALSTLGKKPEKVIPRLLAALENPEFMGSARAGVVRALTWFQVEERLPQESIAAFMKALRDPAGRVVEEAAYALDRGDKEALTPQLLRMLEDPSLPELGRCGVALVLGRFGERAAIPHLAHLLDQEDTMFPMRELSYASPGSCIGHGVKVPLMKRDAAHRLIPFGRLAIEALPALLGNLLAEPGPLPEAAAAALSALQPTRDELEAAFPRVKEKMLRRFRAYHELDAGEQERIENHLRAQIEEALNPRKNHTRGGW